MRIATFNLWGKFGPYLERWALASRVLKRSKPDILCIQEAVHAASLDGVARAAGLSILTSDTEGTGLAILSRLASRSNKLVEYNTRSPFEPYIRKFQCVEIGTGQKSFRVFNTHLSWKAPDDESRAGQAQELADYAGRQKTPAVLCGDFNCEYATAPLEPLKKRGYRDLLAATPDAERPTWDNANPFIQSHSKKFPNRRIDLILADADFLGQFPLKSARIAFDKPDAKGLYPSDHYGVIADFR